MQWNRISFNRYSSRLDASECHHLRALFLFLYFWCIFFRKWPIKISILRAPSQTSLYEIRCLTCFMEKNTSTNPKWMSSKPSKVILIFYIIDLGSKRWKRVGDMKIINILWWSCWVLEKRNRKMRRHTQANGSSSNS